MSIVKLTFPINFLFTILPLLVLGQINDPRTGHNTSVVNVSFSKDNKMLASADENGNVIVWNLVNSKPLYKISGSETERFGNPALSLDGKLLVVTKEIKAQGDKPNRDEVWFCEASTGKLIDSLKGEIGLITNLEFSPDSRMLVVQTTGETSFWDVTTKQKKELPFEVNGVFAFSSNCLKLAAVDNEGKLNVWNLTIGRLIRSFENNESLDSITFNPSGTMLAGTARKEEGSTDGNQIKVWNLTSGLPVKSFAKVKTNGLCEFTADGQNLMIEKSEEFLDFTADNASLELLNVATAEKTGDISIDTDFMGSLAGVSSDLQLAAGTSTSEIHLFDLQKKIELPILKGYSIKVSSMAFLPDGSTLLAAYNDSNVIEWNIATAKLQSLVTPKLKRSQQDDSSVTSVRKVLLCSLGDCIFSRSPLHIYNIKSGMQIDDSEDDLGSAAYIFGSSGKIIARISPETISIYEVPSLHLKNRFVHQLPQFSSDLQIQPAALSPDERLLAVEVKSTIFIYDVVSGKQVSSFSNPQNGIDSIAFLPDGKHLIASQRVDILSGFGLYDITSGKIFRRITGQLPYFAVSRDGQILATVDGDFKTNFWDLNTGKLKLKTKTTYESVSDDAILIFSPDGKKLAIGGVQGIKLLNTASGEEICVLK